MSSLPSNQGVSPLTTEETAQFREVDNVISQSTMTGTPDIALEFGLQVRRTAAISGYVLAKLLYELERIWNLFGIDGNFEDTIQERIGSSPSTTRKYVAMWKSIFENENISEDTKNLLLKRPIGDTLLLTATAAEGNITPEELELAAVAPDKNALRDMILGFRGEHTSSANALRLYIVTHPENNQYVVGTLLARRGSGASRPIGMLFVQDDDPDVQQGIARIKRQLSEV